MIAKISYNITLNRNGYVNRNGTREVVIELYQLGSRAVINTHIRVTDQELRFGRFQECCPLRVEYTRILDEMVRELTRLEMEIICSHRECTPKKLREAWRNNLSRSALLGAPKWVQYTNLASGSITEITSAFTRYYHNVSVWEARIGGTCIMQKDWTIRIANGESTYFSTTKDTANKVNIYKENNKYYIQYNISNQTNGEVNLVIV